MKALSTRKFDKLPEFGILLSENTQCPLSTKIHYAQMSGAKILLLSYSSDNLKEVEVDVTPFAGVQIPVLLLRKSDSEYLYEVSTSVSHHHISLGVLHFRNRLVPDDNNKILVFMTSNPFNNPAYDLIAEMGEFPSLFKSKKLEINFAIGYCSSCKENGYFIREPRCLSGGRYCSLFSGFKSDALVRETLRMICVRNHEPIEKLLFYMVMMRDMFSGSVGNLLKISRKEEESLEKFSRTAMDVAFINAKKVTQCFEDSFIQTDLGGGQKIRKVDPSMDDNALLQKEQKQ